MTAPDIATLVETWAPRLAKAFLDAIALIRDGAQVHVCAAKPTR